MFPAYLRGMETYLARGEPRTMAIRFPAYLRGMETVFLRGKEHQTRVPSLPKRNGNKTQKGKGIFRLSFPAYLRGMETTWV